MDEFASTSLGILLVAIVTFWEPPSFCLECTLTPRPLAFSSRARKFCKCVQESGRCHLRCRCALFREDSSVAFFVLHVISPKHDSLLVFLKELSIHSFCDFCLRPDFLVVAGWQTFLNSPIPLSTAVLAVPLALKWACAPSHS